VISVLIVFLLFAIAFFALNELTIAASTPVSRREDIRLTATPISLLPFSGNLTESIDQVFIPAGRECLKGDHLESVIRQSEIALTPITESEIPPSDSVSEIADSEYGTYRAYLANFREPIFRIFIRERNGSFFALTWTSPHPDFVLTHLVWIGDRVLAFEKSYGYDFREIIGIDIVAQEYVYFAQFGDGFCY
jgi:hypothetical protein